MPSIAEIETRVKQQMDFQPSTANNFNILLRRMVNRARQILFSEASFLFEGSYLLVTQPDVRPADSVTGDRVSVHSTDPWVMSRLSNVTTGFQTWNQNREWDGRMVEITDPNGQTHRRMARTFWTETDGGDLYTRFSIDMPWPNTTDTNMKYRIYTPSYYVGPGVSEIRTARLYDSANWRIEARTRTEMERAGLIDYQGRTAGKPELLYRTDPYELQAPMRTPTVSLNSPTWSGPEGAGQFDFVYTYVMGKIDSDVRNYALPNMRKPKWESAPSPVSAKITATNTGDSIKIDMPDIDSMLGFGTGTPRAFHSGVRKRIYARRYSQDISGGIGSEMESDQRFYFVDEVDGQTTSFIWGGTRIDRQTPLLFSSRYQSVAFFPLPDQRYEIDMRVLYTPIDLVNDTDSVSLNDDCCEALVQKVLELMQEWDGKPDMALKSRQLYYTELGRLTKRYGLIDYESVSRNPARIATRGGFQRSRNVKWTGIT